MNNLLFPIPSWSHKVRIMHPAAFCTDATNMFTPKRCDIVTNALMLALDDKSLTPYQSLKAF